MRSRFHQVDHFDQRWSWACWLIESRPVHLLKCLHILSGLTGLQRRVRRSCHHLNSQKYPTLCLLSPSFANRAPVCRLIREIIQAWANNLKKLLIAGTIYMGFVLAGRLPQLKQFARPTPKFHTLVCHLSEPQWSQSPEWRSHILGFKHCSSWYAGHLVGMRSHSTGLIVRQKRR